MARSHDTAPLVDDYGHPVANARVEAYDVTDDSLQETAYTNDSGIASFVALHDTNDSDLKFMWGLFQVEWRRHIFETGGGGGTPAADHGALAGLGDDDHSQYHTNTRGDARYYTKTLLDGGQLDSRYYTETELDAGQLDTRYYTETEVDGLFTAHGAAADPHAGYRLESADHSHQSAGLQAGKLDHGAALNGLTDNDHTQYILHALATAVNDMLVASGSGVYVKKTLAEVLTILGKAAASGLASLDSDSRLVQAAKSLLDADGDTGFETEQGADDDHARVKTAGTECAVWNPVGILTLAKQSRCRVYEATTDQIIPTGVWRKLAFNTELYDEQNEFVLTQESGTTDGAAGGKLIQSGQNFETTVAVGDVVHNTSDGTFTDVTAVDSDTQLSVTVAVPNAKAYIIYRARFTATVDGYYEVGGLGTVQFVADGYACIVGIYKNGGWIAHGRGYSSGANATLACVGATNLYLAQNDYIELWILHTDPVGDRNAPKLEPYRNLALHRLS